MEDVEELSKRGCTCGSMAPTEEEERAVNSLTEDYGVSGNRQSEESFDGRDSVDEGVVRSSSANWTCTEEDEGSYHTGGREAHITGELLTASRATALWPCLPRWYELMFCV